MIKKIIVITILSASVLSLTACKSQTKQENEEVLIQGQEDFLGEVSIVDGEVVTKPASTQSGDTISVKTGSNFSLIDILSAQYGDDIDVKNIVCTKGTSQINGDNVTVHSNSVIEFDLTLDDTTSHKTLKIIAD